MTNYMTNIIKSNVVSVVHCIANFEESIRRISRSGVHQVDVFPKI